MNGFPLPKLHNQKLQTETKIVRDFMICIEGGPFWHGLLLHHHMRTFVLDAWHTCSGITNWEIGCTSSGLLSTKKLSKSMNPKQHLSLHNEITLKCNYTVRSFPKPYVRGGRNCTNLFAQLRGTSLSNRTNQNLRSFLIICPIVSKNHRDKTKSLEIVLDKNIARLI